MPRQNRVTTYGKIMATNARGTLMGNRGCLHDGHEKILKNSARKAWISCTLHFKERHRQVMTPGQYTELFFLDEATALTAGHRPCATCRREAYNEFTRLWKTEFDSAITISDIDNQLHRERLLQENIYHLLSTLPNGAMIEIPLADKPFPCLIYQGDAYPWTDSCYEKPLPLPEHQKVKVITPPSILQVLKLGYTPTLHKSVDIDTAAKYSQPSTSVQKIAQNTPSLFRLENTPKGKQLFAYFGVIIEVTGMNTGKTFPLKKFLKNLSAHEKTGRIEKCADGYRLTEIGIDYFNDRLRKGSIQYIVQSEIDSYKKGLVEGGAGWKQIL